jgi:hypothetical protein
MASREDIGADDTGAPGGSPVVSVVDLLSDLAGATTALVRDELALARVEIVRNASRLRDKTAVLFCGAMIALLGGQALVAAAAQLVARWVEPWAANLIVGTVLLAIGGPIVVLAWRRLDLRALTPRRTLDNWRQDRATVTDWTRGSAR